MVVTMVTVQSLDGKITRGDDPNVRLWASAEDAKKFAELRAAHDVIVVGRTTYQALRASLKLHKKQLRVVLTAHPERLAGQAVPGQLEFSSEQPAELVARLEKLGYDRMLLTTGGQGNSAFLRAGLVHELYTTVEPYIFGSGAALLANELLNVQLHLQSVKQLNDRGTLLLHYFVERA